MISIIPRVKFSPLSFIREITFRFWLKDAGFKLKRISGHLSKEDSILEIGAGSGSVCFLLKQKGYSVTPLDISDKTLCDHVTPVIYDGVTIPYSEKSYNTALILTVLHHTPDPEHILKEAMRVADNIIIIEDIYNNKLQQYLTYIFDSIFNLEFIGHPHSNKTDSEWKELFTKLGLNLRAIRHDRFLLLFKQVTYSLNSK